MFFYTPLFTEDFVKSYKKIPEPMEIELNGVKLQVQKHIDNQYQIVRIISTNPFDYLNLDLQPGNILTKHF
jgi:hypothetical protein